MLRVEKSARSKPILALLAVVLASAIVLYTNHHLEQRGLAALRDEGSRRLVLYAQTLNAEVLRFDSIPAVLGLHPDIKEMLADPRNRELVSEANSYIEQVNRLSHSSAIYILDQTGKTVATSNWNEPISFMGDNYSYRPYFQNAMKGGKGRFYAIGSTSGLPGYYRSDPITVDGVTRGVMVLKVDLQQLEHVWRKDNKIVTAVDANGVIFLSSILSWKYLTLSNLPPEVEEKIKETRQYQDAQLQPLSIKSFYPLDNNARMVYLSDRSSSSGRTREYIEQRHAVDGTEWKILLLSDTEPVRIAARNGGVIAGALTTILLLLGVYLYERRRAYRVGVAASTRFQQRVRERLEEEVAARTTALVAANERLQHEVDSRNRDQEMLRNAQDGLVHAEKLAALGQMSVGIAHELNQPLVALRTLSDNAVVFMERGRMGDARDNLMMFPELIRKMGDIIYQWKRFARKSPGRVEAVQVDRLIKSALLIVDQQIRAHNVTVDQSMVGEDVRVSCDANRLEQVLVNLFSNAIDSMRGGAERQLTIRATAQQERCLITVSDTGGGVADEALPRLFEPFFTTKEVGLGLGLAISADIVREYGGSLRAENLPEGGACFSIELPRAAASNGRSGNVVIADGRLATDYWAGPDQNAS